MTFPLEVNKTQLQSTAVKGALKLVPTMILASMCESKFFRASHLHYGKQMVNKARPQSLFNRLGLNKCECCHNSSEFSWRTTKAMEHKTITKAVWPEICEVLSNQVFAVTRGYINRISMSFELLCEL